MGKSHRFIQWHDGSFSRMYPLLSMLASCQSGFVFSSSRFGWKVQKCPWLTLDEEEVRTSQFSAQTQIGIRKRFETILLLCLNFVPGKVGASHSSAGGTAWNEANVSEIGGWMLPGKGKLMLIGVSHYYVSSKEVVTPFFVYLTGFSSALFSLHALPL